MTSHIEQPLILYHLTPPSLKHPVFFKPSFMEKEHGTFVNIDEHVSDITDRRILFEIDCIVNKDAPRYMYLKKSTFDMDIATYVDGIYLTDCFGALPYARVILSEILLNTDTLPSKYIHFVNHIQAEDAIYGLDIGMEECFRMKYLDKDTFMDNTVTIFDILVYLKKMFWKRDGLVLSDIPQTVQNEVINAICHLDDNGPIVVMSHTIGLCADIMCLTKTLHVDTKDAS